MDEVGDEVDWVEGVARASHWEGPENPGEWVELATKGLRPNVAGVRLVLSRPGLERYFAGPVACTVWSLPGLKTAPESPGDEE